MNLAAPAQADQSSFVNALDDNGVYYGGSVSWVMNYGKLICQNLRGGMAIEELLDRVHYDGFTQMDSALVVTAASIEMCPDTAWRVQHFAQGGAGSTPTEEVQRPRLNRAE